MSDLTRTIEQVRHLVGDLPDSRTRDQRGQVRTPAGNLTPIFCISCGATLGFALIDTTMIVGICDDCEKKCGGLPLPEIDPEFVTGGEHASSE